MKLPVKSPYYLPVMLMYAFQNWCVRSDKLAVRKVLSSKDESCVGVDGWVEIKFLRIWSRWPCWVISDSGEYLSICFVVIPGKIVIHQLLMALTQEDGAGEFREMCSKSTYLTTIFVGYMLLQMCVIGADGLV